MSKKIVLLLSIILLATSSSMATSAVEVLNKLIINVKPSYMESTIKITGKKNLQIGIKLKDSKSSKAIFINTTDSQGVGDKILLSIENNKQTIYRHSSESDRVRKINRLKFKKILEKSDLYGLLMIFVELGEDGFKESEFDLKEESDYYEIFTKRGGVRLKVKKSNYSLMFMQVDKDLAVEVLKTAEITDNGKKRYFPTELSVVNFKTSQISSVNIDINSIGEKISGSYFSKKSFFK